MAKNNSTPKTLIIAVIKAYKKLLSPLLGKNCRFHPSCSTYAMIAVNRFGVIKGCWLTSKRILKCHPLNAGGHDPVPTHKQEK